MAQKSLLLQMMLFTSCTDSDEEHDSSSHLNSFQSWSFYSSCFLGLTKEAWVSHRMLCMHLSGDKSSTLTVHPGISTLFMSGVQFLLAPRRICSAEHPDILIIILSAHLMAEQSLAILLQNKTTHKPVSMIRAMHQSHLTAVLCAWLHAGAEFLRWTCLE